MRGTGKRWGALALALALTAGLGACGSPGEEGAAPTPTAAPTAASTSTAAPAATETPAPSETAAPAATPTPSGPPAWEEGRTLAVKVPKRNQYGLEVTVVGATGYAGVEMALWPEPTAVPAAVPAAVTTAAPAEAATPAPASAAPAGEIEILPEPPAAAPGPAEGPAAGEEPLLPPGEAGETPPTPSGGLPASAPPAESAEGAEAPASTEASASTGAPAPTPAPYAGALAVLEPGDGFTILREKGSWWQVAADAGTGWVEHRYCLINLPDVIPSMLYDATNSYRSLYVSAGKDIPGVTGKALYPGKAYNPRLERKEYLMPMLYAAAKKVCAAQHEALAQGNCLKLYEAYRPRDTQRAVVKGLKALAEKDAQVKAGITTAPWNISYFINTGVSNHQKGFAVDVSLARVTACRLESLGGESYVKVTAWAEYEMPTAMHELSMAAASTLAPGSKTLADTMNEPAIALRGYFTKAGMTPLESEWWHFNDFSARTDRQSVGEYVISRCYSRAPGG